VYIYIYIYNYFILWKKSINLMSLEKTNIAFTFMADRLECTTQK